MFNMAALKVVSVRSLALPPGLNGLQEDIPLTNPLLHFSYSA